MLHIVLYADGTKADDIAIPDWKALVTTEDERFADRSFTRYVLRYKACLVLWVQTDGANLFGLKAYCNRLGVTEFHEGKLLPTEALAAREAIAKAIELHKGVSNASRWTSVK